MNRAQHSKTPKLSAAKRACAALGLKLVPGPERGHYYLVDTASGRQYGRHVLTVKQVLNECALHGPEPTPPSPLPKDWHLRRDYDVFHACGAPMVGVQHHLTDAEIHEGHLQSMRDARRYLARLRGR